MSFANPWMLLGLLAGLIPLAVHLFDRRRPRSVQFGAMQLLLRSQKRMASRLRLRRILLYTLRTLIFVALPIALAQPQRETTTVVATPRRLAATAIAVDTSLLLRWASSKPIFDEARSAAQTALASLAPEEQATLIACGNTSVPVVALTLDRERLAAGLAQLRAGYEAADVNRCLETALRSLDGATLAPRRIILVSPLAAGSVSFVQPPPKENGVRPEILLRQVAASTNLDNRAIIEARAEPTPELGPKTWRFNFTVKNYSSSAVKDLELALMVDDTVVAKGFVDLGAQETASKSLTYKFLRAGNFVVRGTLPRDALHEDDTRTLLVNIPLDATGLIINGSPSSQRYSDEAYFLEAGLSAPGSPVKTTVRGATSAPFNDLASFGAVFFVGVETITKEQAQALTTYVNAGGGLFVSMGELVQPEEWNATALLRNKMRVVKTAPGQGALLRSFQANHPIFAPFSGRGREGLLASRFRRYMLFESDSTAATTEILATLDDGAPLMLASRQGRGRVLLFASSAGQSWTDFPLRTAYLPVMQRTAAWLINALDVRPPVYAVVGNRTVITPVREAPALLTTPSGESFSLVSNATNETFTTPILLEPGRYTLADANGRPLPDLSFVANLDPKASDSNRIPLPELARWLESEEVIASSTTESETESAPAWSWLFSLVAVAYFFEGVLVRR